MKTPSDSLAILTLALVLIGCALLAGLELLAGPPATFFLLLGVVLGGSMAAFGNMRAALAVIIGCILLDGGVWLIGLLHNFLLP